MNRSLAPAAVLLLALSAYGQTSAPQSATIQPLPKDPVALLKLAWDQNGLHGSDLKPWHVRATWTEVDQKGNATNAGTWEEWWAGENKYKISYTSDNFRQILYVTDRGTFVTGNTDAPSWNFELIEEAVTAPIPDPQYVSHSLWREKKQKRGAAEITWVRADSDVRYCFADELPIMRIYISNAEERTTESLMRFQGRYLARKVRVEQTGLPEIDITLDQVETIPSTIDVNFAPPQDAVAAQSVLVPSYVLTRRPFLRKPVEFPAIPESWYGIHVVWLDVTIRANGDVGDVNALSGPPALEKQAMESVRARQYEPYLLAGTPVTVRTRINFIYQFDP